MVRQVWLAALVGVVVGTLVLLPVLLTGSSPSLLPVIAVLAASGATAAGAVALTTRLLVPYRALPTVLRETEERFQHSLEETQRDRAQMVTIFQHMADGLLVIDADEHIALSNAAAQRLLRQPRLEGLALAEVVRDPDLVETVRAVRTAAPVSQLVELRSDPRGPRAWIHIVATRVASERRTLVLLQDVTELRRAEAARRDFVANVSHELRTPVASLKALVETLEAGAIHDPSDGPDFLRRMHVEVDGLAQLVTELLELARIEAGRLELDLQLCRADELVGDAVERIRPYASRVEVEVSCIAPLPVEVWVRADARRIGQVLSNLLSNAVKFTPPGGRVQAGVRRTDGFAELWVEDSGVGIAADQLVRVFERFYKTDPSRAGSGTGLGLAICKHVVRAHGGSIWADSAGAGRGATFTFTLVARDPPHERAGSTPADQSALPPPPPARRARSSVAASTRRRAR